MNYGQLRAMQMRRKSHNVRPEPVRRLRCSYCGRWLVRLKTVARCYKVIWLGRDHVVWKDANGKTQRDYILTKDHILPRSKGGTDDPSNIAYACGPCNWQKDNTVGTRLPDGRIILGEDDNFAA